MTGGCSQCNKHGSRSSSASSTAREKNDAKHSLSCAGRLVASIRPQNLAALGPNFAGRGPAPSFLSHRKIRHAVNEFRVTGETTAQKSSGNSFMTTSTHSELMCGVGSWLFMVKPPSHSRATKPSSGRISARTSHTIRAAAGQSHPVRFDDPPKTPKPQNPNN